MSNLILSLIPKGCRDHRRFLIADQHQNVWTGDGWSIDPNDGLLLLNEADAGQICNAILGRHYHGKPATQFVAPVMVEFRGDHPSDLMQLQMWLSKAGEYKNWIRR